MYKMTTDNSNKHVMLSYQWDHQKLVERVCDGLNGLGVPTWMDIKGGMQNNVNDSMAFGVDNAAVICCFMSPQYQESKNCKKELNYADSNNVPIVPIMLQKNWKASQWLGIITAGLLWIDFREVDNIDKRIESLAKEIIYRAENNITLKQQERPKTAGAKRANVDLEKKPGRAFCHLQTGKYLAESGEGDGGLRNNLVLSDKPKATSYWVEEQESKGSEIYYYKNYSTNAYLGYDPNGDYIYTKGQHFDAEKWLLLADESSKSGERSVVIFAYFGKRYLAVRNGQLTGVCDRAEDCVWTLA